MHHRLSGDAIYETVQACSQISSVGPANIAHLQTSIAILDFECTFCSTASLNTAVPISNCYLIARFSISIVNSTIRM